MNKYFYCSLYFYWNQHGGVTNAACLSEKGVRQAMAEEQSDDVDRNERR